MRVVLINMRTSYIMSIPFGITYLGAVLREQGYDVRLVDLYPDDDVKQLCQILKKDFPPDIIGFSLMTTNYHRTKRLKLFLAQAFPKSIFCAGGIHPTVRPEETLSDMALDFVVLGEGENPFLRACNAIHNGTDLNDIQAIAFKRDSEYHINSGLDIVQDLDTLPFPARYLLPLSRYLVPPGYIRSQFMRRVMSILTSRGCPGKCTFCNSASIFQRKIRRRSVDNVMAELDYLVRTYSLDGIYFHDETFTLNHTWVRALCERIEPYKLNWGCQTRVNTVSDELLSVMKRAGCVQIDFGIETASPTMLKAIKKAQTPDQIVKALQLTKKHRIKSFASLMVGLPAEREEDVLENIRFLQKHKPDFTYFNLFTPFPGTEAAEMAIAQGKMPKDYFKKDYDMLLETEPLVNLSNMDTPTVIKYHRKLRNLVLFNNYSSIITIKNIGIIMEAIFKFFLSPKEMISAVKEFVKIRNTEKFIFLIFSNYQKKQADKYLRRA